MLAVKCNEFDFGCGVDSVSNAMFWTQQEVCGTIENFDAYLMNVGSRAAGLIWKVYRHIYVGTKSLSQKLANLLLFKIVNNLNANVLGKK